MRSDELLAMMRESWNTGVKPASEVRALLLGEHPEQCMCTDCLKACTSDVYAQLLRDASKVSKHYLMPGLDTKVREVMRGRDTLYQFTSEGVFAHDKKGVRKLYPWEIPVPSDDALRQFEGFAGDESGKALGEAMSKHMAAHAREWKIEVISVNQDYDSQKQAKDAEKVINELWCNSETYRDLLLEGKWDLKRLDERINQMMMEAAENIAVFGHLPNPFERRLMQQQRDHEARINAMTNDEMFDWRERMAREVIERPPCPNCNQYSYHDVIGMLKHTPSMSLEEFIHYGELRELPYTAGYVKACDACKAMPVERRDWIRNIPLDAFRKFQAENPGTYVVDDMKVLLPKCTYIGPKSDCPKCSAKELTVSAEQAKALAVPYSATITLEAHKPEKKGFEFL